MTAIARAHFLLLIIVFLISSCAGGMLPGRMYSLDDGNELTFEIEKSRGTGSMTAYNTATGERFGGQYTGRYTGGGSSFGTVSGQGGNIATVQSFTPPTGATARGILRGNQGTVIDVYLDITPGFRPTGFGEGLDNKGRRYQIQF